MSSGSQLHQDDIPPIYVSSSGYDDMGAILDELDIRYNSLEDVSLDDHSRGVVMLNCKTGWRVSTFHPQYRSLQRSFEEFISQGGSAIVSDFAGKAITNFTDASFDTSTTATEVTASVEDAELAELLGQSTIDLTFDMGGWFKPDQMPAGSEPLLRNEETSEVLAYKFPYREGTTVYTAFHNHAQVSDIERALLRLLVVIPIADSTESTVKETYTTIVGADASGSTVVEQTTIVDAPETSVEQSVTVNLEPSGVAGKSLQREITAGETIQFGREDFHDMVTNAGYISGQHFEIHNPGDKQDHLLRIQDTDSTNGTRVNEIEINDGRSHELENGDTIMLGDDIITLQVEFW